MEIPSVVIDHNAKTSIIVKEGPKYVHLVTMRSGKLTVTSMTREQLNKLGLRPLPTDVNSAIKAFLNHSGGLTQTAEYELRRIYKVR